MTKPVAQALPMMMARRKFSDHRIDIRKDWSPLTNQCLPPRQSQRNQGASSHERTDFEPCNCPIVVVRPKVPPLTLYLNRSDVIIDPSVGICVWRIKFNTVQKTSQERRRYDDIGQRNFHLHLPSRWPRLQVECGQDHDGGMSIDGGSCPF